MIRTFVTFVLIGFALLTVPAFAEEHRVIEQEGLGAERGDRESPPLESDSESFRLEYPPECHESVMTVVDINSELAAKVELLDYFASEYFDLSTAYLGLSMSLLKQLREADLLTNEDHDKFDDLVARGLALLEAQKAQTPATER